MSRDLKEFAASFLQGVKLAEESRRNDIYEGRSKQQDGAWTQGHEDMYRRQYGNPSPWKVVSGTGRRGLLDWMGIRKPPSNGMIMNAAPASSTEYAPISSSPLPDLDTSSAGTASADDTTAVDAEAAASTGGVIRAIPGYERGGLAAGNTNDYIRARQVAEEETKPRIPMLPSEEVYDENGQPTSWYAGGRNKDVATSGPNMRAIPAGPDPERARSAPFEYPGAEVARAPVLYDDKGQPTGIHMPAPGGNPGSAGSTGKGGSDQQRTAAYDPEKEGPPAGSRQATGEPVSLAPKRAVPSARERQPNTNAGGDGLNRRDNSDYSTNNVSNDILGQALDGGIQYGMHVFHMKGDGVAVGKDPHQERGREAFYRGVGAAEPDSVRQVDDIVKATSADKQALEGPLGQSMLGMRRLEIVYQHYVQTGQTEKANKAAFELMQYGAGESAKLGAAARDQLRAGDVNGATNNIVKALDEIPDGRKVTIGQDGKTAVWTDTRTGKVVGEYKFGPKELFDMALGLSNRSTYWNVIMQRAAMTNPGMQKDAKAAREEELLKSRIELNKARTDKLRQPKALGASADPSPLAAQLEAIEAKRIPRPATQKEPAAPVPQGDGGTPGPREVDDAEEDATHGLDAPPDLKDRLPPESPVRLNKPTLRQGIAPAESVPVSGPEVAQPPIAPAGKYDTKLSPEDEEKFQKWAGNDKIRRDTSDYDMRGFWKAAGKQADDGHYPDKFKKPSHPTFSDESVYHGKDGHEGGKWTQIGKDKWAFEPGQTNLRNGIDKTRAYLKQSDPGVELREAAKEEDLPGVPDVVLHNDKPVAMTPPKAPEFNEPHPLQPYGGKNPYTALLADPKNSPYFATKQGRSDKTGLTRKAAEMDRDIQDWDHRRKEHMAEFAKAHAGDVAALRAEAKSVYDKPIAPVVSERLVQEHIKPEIDALAKPDADPNVFKDGALKPDEGSAMTLQLLERNRALPVGHAVKMISELTRSGTPGEDDKSWRAFTPKGKDLAGNVIVQLNGDKSVELHLAPSTYKKINSVVEKRYRLKEEAAKNPKEATLLDNIKKHTSVTMADVLAAPGEAADYLTSPEGLPGVQMDNPKGRSGFAAHVLGANLLPTRLARAGYEYLKANPNGPMIAREADVTGPIDPNKAIGGRTTVNVPKRAIPRWGGGS